MSTVIDYTYADIADRTSTEIPDHLEAAAQVPLAAEGYQVKPIGMEAKVAAAVERGILEIDDLGQIWRLGQERTRWRSGAES